MRKIYLIGILFVIISCETKQAEKNVDQKKDPVSTAENPVSQISVDEHLPVCTLIPENNYGKGIDASRPMGAIKRFFWPEAKKILNVQFLDGSPDIQQKIIEYAKEWENYCGIQFNFNTTERADITITCNTKGYWSYIGTQSKLKQPSMGFDLLNKTVSNEELRQYVLHEFGHALGLIHEHQNPQNNPIHWNKEKVYHYYKVTQNWSKEKVDTNFFTRFENERLMASEFDPQSIMLYAVAREFTIDGFSTTWNSQLSENDKNFYSVNLSEITMCRWFIFKRYLLVSFIGMTFSYCGNSTTESNQTVSVKTTGTGDTFVIPKAQTSGRLISNGRACYFDKVDSTEMALNILLETANPRETELVRSMMSYTGLPANFSIYRGDVSNALATQYQNERLIIYNKDLFSRIDRESHSYWSSVFIMAHEIGHHLSFNLHSSNSMESELEADRFAAAILYKMGADSSQVQLAVRSKFISNRVDTKTHPSKSRRLEAIQNSWLKSAELSLDKASPPPPHDQDVFKELNIQQMWNITMCGDDFGPWVPEHDDVELIKSIEIQGIVLSKKDNNKENLNPEHQKMATILIQITGISETQENQIGLTVGEKSEFEAYYCESRVTANTNLFEEIFKPGRRIIFDAYGIAENDYFRVRIAKIRTAIQ